MGIKSRLLLMLNSLVGDEGDEPNRASSATQPIYKAIYAYSSDSIKNLYEFADISCRIYNSSFSLETAVLIPGRRYIYPCSMYSVPANFLEQVLYFGMIY